ncbi:MAG: hypothetical protein AAGK17_12505, partial [Pseudomonadota bacterium]
ALLQRATILARHDLWEHALSDWQAACSIDAPPLTQLENDICRRAMAGKHGFAGALEPVAIKELRALKKNAATGHAIVRQLAEGLIWRLRDPDESNRALAWQFASQTGTRTDLLKGLVSRLLPGSQSETSPHTLREVSELPLLD